MDQKRLNNYKWLVRNIEDLENEVQRLRDAMDVKSQVFSADPKGESKERDKTCATIAALVDVENMLLDQIKLLWQERAAIESAIETLSEVEKRVIRKRYFERVDFNTIAYQMRYSVQRIYQFHNRALKMLK